MALARFVNTDLDLVSDADPTALVRDLELVDEPGSFTDGISHATLARAVAVGLSIRITIDPG